MARSSFDRHVGPVFMKPSCRDSTQLAGAARAENGLILGLVG